jgi:hypothetical protein
MKFKIAEDIRTPEEEEISRVLMNLKRPYAAKEKLSSEDRKVLIVLNKLLDKYYWHPEEEYEKISSLKGYESYKENKEMKFKFTEDVGQDIKTVEQNSNLILEFQIYTPDESSPGTDQYVAQLEQRLAAFGVENAEQKNESGKPYSMYRLIGKKFQSTQQMLDFFQKEFTDFVKLVDQIWKQSDNFIRIVVVDDSKPPKRIPGRTYTLLSTTDYQDMLTSLKGA